MKGKYWVMGNRKADAVVQIDVKEQEKQALLKQLAKRYIWWETPAEAVRYPMRVLAQVMNLGDYDDIQRMVEVFGDEALRDVIRHAEIGWLDERSWAYWHYRLGMAEPEQVPPLPTRKIG